MKEVRKAVITAADGKIELIEGDVLDATTLERAISNIDVIFHFASLSERDAFSRSAIEVHAVNTTATLQLLDVARTARVCRLIFGSSSAVYGRQARS